MGAIALVLAAGFGVKFAYDQGWFQLVSPTARLAVLLALALLLLGIGGVVYRRVSRLSATGFFAAGVAVLFLASYAGHAFYGLYGAGAAWTMMGVSTAIGAAVAWRSDSVPVAALSLIGGYLAPVVIGEHLPSAAAFCGYLFTLQGVALLLAWRADVSWWMLRGLSLAGAALWLALLLPTPTFSDSSVVVLFLLLAGMAYQAELIASCQWWSTRPAVDGPAVMSVQLTVPNFSLLVTAAVTVGGLYHFRSSLMSVRAEWVLGLAAATGITGLSLRRARAFTPVGLRPLALSFVIQAVALLAVAVPVILSGLWIASAWAVLALALAVLARRLDLTTARGMAIAIWGLAVLDCFFWTAGFNPWNSPAHPDRLWFTLADAPVPAYTGMSLLLCLVGQAIARLIDLPTSAGAPPDQRWHDLSHALALAADALALLATIVGVPPLRATALLSIESILLAIGGVISNEPPLLSHAAGLLVITAGKWLGVDTFAARWLLDTLPAASTPLLNAVTGDGLLLIAASLTTSLLAGSGSDGSPSDVPDRRFRFRLNWNGRSPWMRCVNAAPVPLLLWIGSFEIDRAFRITHAAAPGPFSDPALAEQVAFSVFWSLFAIATVVAGFARSIPFLRYFGLGLFAITASKIVVVDMNQVSAGYRIFSFLALGSLLLGTSVVYGRVSGMSRTG